LAARRQHGRSQRVRSSRSIGSGCSSAYAENDPEIQARLGAFRQALEGNGWKGGGSVHIDYRFAPASPDQAQIYAKELIALQPDVLVGNSTPATAALLHETRTIPIVFVSDIILCSRDRLSRWPSPRPHRSNA
jgi:putative tryptophan/tyrosine transport system substrate-binding protein